MSRHGARTAAPPRFRNPAPGLAPVRVARSLGRSPLLVHVGLVEVVEHAVKRRHLAVRIGNDGEVDVGRPGNEVVNVLDPAGVGRDVVGGESDELGAVSAGTRPRSRVCRRDHGDARPTLTPLDSKSAYESATAESSVVQTGVCGVSGESKSLPKPEPEPEPTPTPMPAPHP